jgi:hypothetical protein
MLFSRLACHTPHTWFFPRTGIRMASSIVGESGRVYVPREVLQQHRQDPKFNIFKAEYVRSLSLSPFRPLADQVTLDLRTSLSSSSACPDISTICPYASQPSSQRPVGSACMSTVMRRRAFYFIRITEIPCLPSYRRILTSPTRHAGQSCVRQERQYKSYIARTGSTSVRLSAIVTGSRLTVGLRRYKA